jgi:hypothetical protein
MMVPFHFSVVSVYIDLAIYFIRATGRGRNQLSFRPIYGCQNGAGK